MGVFLTDWCEINSGYWRYHALLMDKFVRNVKVI